MSQSQSQYPPQYRAQHAQEPPGWEEAPERIHSVPIQPLPFSEPYTLAGERGTDPLEVTYANPIDLYPAPHAKKLSSRWLVGAGILGAVLVLACVGGFAVLGIGAKSVSDKITKDQRAAATDVRVSGCSRDKATGFMSASLTITNHGTDTASYVVDIAFDSADGTHQFDSGVAAAHGLAGGQTSTVRAAAQSAGPAAFVCTIIDATRF